MLPGILRISADENFRQRAIFSALLSAEILSDKESLFISSEGQFDDKIGLLIKNVYHSSFHQKDNLTTESGSPMETKTATMSVGPRGPLLLQDNNFIEDMAHFDRERIPERVVHAKV